MLATLLSLVTAPPRPATRLVADTAHLSLIARTPLAAAEAEAAAAASAPLAPLAALCGLPGGTVLWVSSSGEMALLQPPGLAAEAVEVADSPPAAPLLADARPAAPGGAGGAATLAMASAGGDEILLFTVHTAPRARATLLCRARVPTREALAAGGRGGGGGGGAAHVTAVRVVAGGYGGAPSSLIIVGTADGLLLAYAEAGCTLARVLAPSPAALRDGAGAADADPAVTAVAQLGGQRVAYAVGGEVRFAALLAVSGRRPETATPVCRPGLGRVVALAADETVPGLVWAGGEDGRAAPLLPLFMPARWVATCGAQHVYTQLAAEAGDDGAGVPRAPGLAFSTVPGLLAAANAHGLLLVNASELQERARTRTRASATAAAPAVAVAVDDAVVLHAAWDGGGVAAAALTGARMAFFPLPHTAAGEDGTGLAVAAGGLLETHRVSAHLVRPANAVSDGILDWFSAGPLRLLYLVAVIFAASCTYRMRTAAGPKPAGAGGARLQWQHARGRRRYDGGDDEVELEEEDEEGEPRGRGLPRRGPAQTAPPTWWQALVPAIDTGSMLKVLGVEINGIGSGGRDDDDDGMARLNRRAMPRLAPAQRRGRASDDGSGSDAGGDQDGDDGDDAAAALGYFARHDAGFAAQRDELFALDAALERATEQARLRRRGGSRQSPQVRALTPPPPLPPPLPPRTAGGSIAAPPPATPLLPRLRAGTDSSLDDDGGDGPWPPPTAPQLPLSGPARWAAAAAAYLPPGGDAATDAALADQLLAQLRADPASAQRRAARERFVAPRTASPTHFAEERMAARQAAAERPPASAAAAAPASASGVGWLLPPASTALARAAAAAAAARRGDMAMPAATAAAAATAARAWSRGADDCVRDPDTLGSSDDEEE